MDMDKPRVLLSLPHMGTSHVANSAAVESVLLRDDRVQLHVVRCSGVPFSSNMNQVIREFLKGDWDYWINLDEDQAPINNPIDLVFLDRDVIGLPTPAFKLVPGDKGLPFYWNVYAWDEQNQTYRPHQARKEDGPLQEVDAVGSGCWVVARRVLEAIKEPMTIQCDEDGVVKIGGDLSFCGKARAAGFKVYAHYDYPSRHFKTVDLYEVMRMLLLAKEGKL